MLPIRGKINKPFCLENALTLTQEISYDNFSKKILVYFLVLRNESIKIYIKKKRRFADFSIHMILMATSRIKYD